MSALPSFTNEPVLELRRASVRSQLSDALSRVEQTLPVSVPVTIGADVRAGEGLDSTDPGEPDRVVAKATSATEADAASAVEVANDGARAWREAGASERAAALIGAAAWMRTRRLELAALEVRECAKPWPEADADVCEAIDFLEYYARGAVALEAGGRCSRCPGSATSCATSRAASRR